MSDNCWNQKRENNIELETPVSLFFSISLLSCLRTKKDHGSALFPSFVVSEDEISKPSIRTYHDLGL